MKIMKNKIGNVFSLIIFLDSTKLKTDRRFSPNFLDEAFQSYYDLFQVN